MLPDGAQSLEFGGLTAHRRSQRLFPQAGQRNGPGRRYRDPTDRHSSS
jgi:hypothetical protein